MWTFALATTATLTSASVAPCPLTSSGPIEVKADGEIIENLFITTTSKVPAIMVQGKKNVQIRNVKIHHTEQTEYPYGNGIYFTDADDLTIDGVEVELVGRDSGKLPDFHNYNIYCTGSLRPRVSNVRVKGGSTGIEFHNCADGTVSNFVAENVRGPYPRGQCFQASQSDNVVLEDFYCKNDETAWTEDSISIYRSSNSTVRRGLVDGNNSPNGVGVMLEQDDVSKTVGLVEDVDAINQGDGCFSTYGGTDIVFNRVRCRDNHCEGWSGRDKPSSNSLLFAAGDESGTHSSNIQLVKGEYFNACNPDNLFWEATPGAWTKKDLSKVDFKPHDPVTVQLCFDQTLSVVV